MAITETGAQFYIGFVKDVNPQFFAPYLVSNEGPPDITHRCLEEELILLAKQIGTVVLPAGTVGRFPWGQGSPDTGDLSLADFAVTSAKIDDNQTMPEWFFGSNEEQKKKWKEEGKCEECGLLLPMSIHGLGDCPQHPKPTKGYV